MTTPLTLRCFALGSALLFGSCVAEASERSVTDAQSDEHAAHEEAAGSEVLGLVGPWTVTADDGSHVTLTTSAEAALQPGPVTFSITVHSTDGKRSPHSVDLVSPSMPLHGVLRHDVTDGEVDIDIPMEGRWAIYVNLDETGATTAEFQFDVPAGDAGGHMHPGGS